MNKKKIVILIIIAAVAISIGLYTILPLFTNTVIFNIVFRKLE